MAFDRNGKSALPEFANNSREESYGSESIHILCCPGRAPQKAFTSSSKYDLSCQVKSEIAECFYHVISDSTPGKEGNFFLTLKTQLMEERSKD